MFPFPDRTCRVILVRLCRPCGDLVFVFLVPVPVVWFSSSVNKSSSVPVSRSWYSLMLSLKIGVRSRREYDEFLGCDDVQVFIGVVKDDGTPPSLECIPIDKRERYYLNFSFSSSSHRLVRRSCHSSSRRVQYSVGSGSLPYPAC